MIVKKSLELELKSLDDERGIITGVASVYGNVDSDGEIIDRKCFSRSLSMNNGRVPVLWTHDPKIPIGFATKGEDQAEGVYVEAQLMLNTEHGRMAYEYAKLAKANGKALGLSVGFRPTKDGRYLKDGIVHYSQAQLMEWSCCVFPSNLEAQVESVKNQRTKWEATDMADLELLKKALRGDAPEMSEEQKQFIESVDAIVKERVAESQQQANTTVKSDDMDGSSAPMTFEHTMASHQAITTLNGERSDMERAKEDCIDNIKNSGKAKSDKMMLIHKAAHAYADHLTAWHGQQMDAEDQYGKSADGEPLIAKGMNADDHLKAQRKLGRGLAHIEEHKALALASTEHARKGAQMLTDVATSYLRNDVNLPNPEPTGDSKKKSDDSTTLQSEDFAFLAALMVIPEAA